MKVQAAATDPVVSWLLDGDPSIRWQALRDLCGLSGPNLESEQARVARTGWGRQLLDLQFPDGQWGPGLYTPKWTSTTYTLLLLRALGLPPANKQARTGTVLLLEAGLDRDGGINLWRPRITCSETCVTGMVLAIAAHFAAADQRVHRLAQHLLEQQMSDGGWNCQRPQGATHSSLHTTMSVLEGLLEYETAGGKLAPETRPARESAHEFLFRHRMFRSHRTGAVIDDRMTRFSFPPHWWIGMWSPHPIVSSLLCLAFRRSRRLHELVTRAGSVSLDCQPHTQHPFLIIVDTLPLTLEETAASMRKVMATFPQSKLIGLVDPRGGDIIQLLRLGVSGLVQASTNLETDLAYAITTIDRGSIWVPESVLLEHAARVQSVIACRLAPHTVLSAREAEVLDSVIWGRSNKEIASILVITERTVKFHVSNILSKLRLERRTELVRWHEAI